ncbi:unnamed protein product [Musa acuminata subsp. malaccensis]|uniref:(wild Malaysian banana) hypothetical protein n=1 Tax=Musa acuminata subsp. malaccensis TaxID=214687 RepID=A0A804IX31_MUSAM|nr:unnamed protein product [Musa acuminata subsp. malaccensis]
MGAPRVLWALLGLRRDAVLGDQVLVLIAVLLENPELTLLWSHLLSACWCSMTISGWVFMILVGFTAAARSLLTVIYIIEFEGVAVGCGWQAFVAYVNVACYYIVGVISLASNLAWEQREIWEGMIGGTTIPTLILLWVAFQTDWNKEVEEAKRRLSKREEEKEPLLS